MYLIEDQTGCVKIGVSRDPKRRKGTLATGASSKLTLAHSWKLPAFADAFALEQALHRVLRFARTSREWHRLEVGEIRSVGSLILAGQGEQADALAHEIRLYREAAAEIDRQHDLAQSGSPRWQREDRLLAKERANDAYAIYGTARAEALELGLEPSELDLWRAERSWAA